MREVSEVRAYKPRVTVVPATRNRFTATPIANARKRRVAAYARVSTNSEEQKTSYEAQVSYDKVIEPKLRQPLYQGKV